MALKGCSNFQWHIGDELHFSVAIENLLKNHLPVPQTPSESERPDEASEASNAPGHSELPDNKNKNKREGRGNHVYLSEQEGAEGSNAGRTACLDAKIGNNRGRPVWACNPSRVRVSC